MSQFKCDKKINSIHFQKLSIWNIICIYNIKKTGGLMMGKYPLLESLRGIGERLRSRIKVAIEYEGCVL